MTNSERKGYDTDQFVQDLATMKRRAAARKPGREKALAPSEDHCEPALPRRLA